jgi:protein NirF
MTRALVAALILAALAPRPFLAGGVGSRVFIVERETGSLAVYDLKERRLLPQRIESLGNLRHATMIFTPDLSAAFLATRGGQVSRIDLQTLAKTGEVFTSQNSIDNAISQDGRWLAVAEYVPGGLTILDAATMKVAARHEAWWTKSDERRRSRVTGVVDAPGNRFACVSIEGAEIWIVDASSPGFPIEHRIPTAEPQPYDAMITPDGRYYVVVHLNSPKASVLDLRRPERGVRTIELRPPDEESERTAPIKLPHVASWAVAGDHCFVPLVGEKRLAVLDRRTWEHAGSIPLRGHPVYSVRSPSGGEIWVSFSGERDDAFVQVVDTESLEVVAELEVGKRIYHLDFTPRGSHVLVSANGANRLFLVDAATREIVDSEELRSPSGVFGPWRAFRLGL